MAKVLIVYHSETGNTRAMAQAVAEGVKEVPGVPAALKEAEQLSVSDLIDADALAFGSPTYFPYTAGVIKATFNKAYLSRSRLKGKPFAAFASGGGGEVKSVQSVESLAASCGLCRACEGIAVGGMPTDSNTQDCGKVGTTLAKAGKMKCNIRRKSGCVARMSNGPNSV